MRTRTDSGFTLIEVLIALLVVSFALLGMAGLITRGTVVEIENAQRSHALQLAREMAERIQANRAAALTGAYDRSTAISPNAAADCSSAADRAALDLCEWGRQLGGVNENDGASAAASSVLVAARGCVALVAGTTNAYTVTVMWRGAIAAGAPARPCGVATGEDQNFLRTVTTRVELGRLDG